MLKITVTVLALVLAGTASAEGWRKLQIDASSEAAFNESVVTFQKKLSPSRRVAFAMSLEDIWLAGSRRAEEQQRERGRMAQAANRREQRSRLRSIDRRIPTEVVAVAAGGVHAVVARH